MKTQTKQIMAEVGKDTKRNLARAGKSTLKGLEQVVCKASYPVLGNLSTNLQTRIENLVGKEHYNAYSATVVSILSNGIISGSAVMGANMEEYSEILQQGTCVITGVAASLIDMGLRSFPKKGFNYGESGGIATASLPGKIISLPFDAMTYVYDSVKEYLQGVKRRVQSQNETEGRIK